MHACTDVCMGICMCLWHARGYLKTISTVLLQLLSNIFSESRSLTWLPCHWAPVGHLASSPQSWDSKDTAPCLAFLYVLGAATQVLILESLSLQPRHGTEHIPGFLQTLYFRTWSLVTEEHVLWLDGVTYKQLWCRRQRSRHPALEASGKVIVFSASLLLSD